MNILRKQSLLVATVAAIIILLVNNVVADNNLEKTTRGVMLSPPPGPFFKGASAIVSKKGTLVSPVAPPKPVNNLQRPEPKANSLAFKMDSPKSEKIIALKEPKLTSLQAKKLIAPVMQKNAPELVQKIGQAPSNLQMPKNHLKKPSLMGSPSAPIWMQGGSLINQNSNSQSQGNKANIGYKNYNGIPNMGWNYPHPVRQYMYVPVPMMVPSTVPQMPLAPRFNYGAKMPFYNNTPIDNDNNRAIDKSAISVQKENK